jgi:hypothetical protein
MADRLWSRLSYLHPVGEARAFLLHPGIQNSRVLDPWRFDTGMYGTVRIRFLRSVHWITDQESDPALFFSAFKFPAKKHFFQTSFAYYILEDGRMEGSGSGNNYGSGPGRPKNLRNRIWNTPEISTQFLHHTMEIFALGQGERRKWI